MKKIVLSATFLAAMAATHVHAETFEPYGSVEGWNIFVDVEKKSCLIETIDAAENVVQMGLTRDRSVGYLGLFTKAETDIRKGDKEAVVVLIGDHIYVGEATLMRGNITKGYSGGYVLTDDPQFVTDIAQQYEMIVFPEKAWAFTVDLTGTKKAIEAARECNAKQMQ